MEPNDARLLARELLDKYNLRDWSFELTYKNYRWFGLCEYTTKTIKMPIVGVCINEEHIVKDTILHEIAHALAGSMAGHGIKWRRMASVIGATPRACYGSEVKR